jgi:predicted nucleotidyltransferase
MGRKSELLEIIKAKLRQDKDSELLKTLLNLFAEGGSEIVEGKIKEIVSNIEGNDY